MPCFATAVVGISSGAGGPSFDQVLGAELGSATKFRTLVGHREQADGASEGATSAHMNNISWSGPGTPRCRAGPPSASMIQGSRKRLWLCAIVACGAIASAVGCSSDTESGANEPGCNDPGCKDASTDRGVVAVDGSVEVAHDA